MENYILPCSPDQWDDNVAANNGHLLQSWAWGELKSHFGWTPLRVQIDGAAAQILFRRLPFGQTIAYIPKGPMVDWVNLEQRQALFSAIHSEAKKRRAVFLKIEPNIGSADCSSHSQTTAINFLEDTGFIVADTIQPQTSIVVDIRGDEDSILAAMKQKTRYNIRLAERKGVVVRQGSDADIPLFHNLSRLTSTRACFPLSSTNIIKQTPEQPIKFIFGVM